MTLLNKVYSVAGGVKVQMYSNCLPFGGNVLDNLERVSRGSGQESEL